MIKETIKKPTATELLTLHYEELKQKKKQDKSDKTIKLTFLDVENNNLVKIYINYAYEKS